MTDDQLKSVHDDIAYMRSLAQEGRNTPLLCGSVLVAAALIFGSATLGQWAIAAGVLQLSPWAPLWLWVGAGVLFTAVLMVLVRRMDIKPGAQSPANRAVGAAWSAVGFGIFAMWVALMAIGATSGDWAVMRVMPLVVFTAYGAAWMVAGTMVGIGWMKGVALIAYAGAVLLGVFADSAWGYLVFAGLMVFVALLPGLALMRQEPSDVV
jgi:hypothetical protein